jgi:hypothetical protein
MLYYSQEWGHCEGGREVLAELLTSWQLPHKLNGRGWGGGGLTDLAHHSCQSTYHGG